MPQIVRDPILRTGRNCWRIERAQRFALIIDAQDYFRAVKSAILQARHSVYLIGWDFDTRIKFEPEGSTLDGPNKLGRFLKWIGKTRPDLSVYILKWNLGALQSLGRGAMPFTILNLMTSPNIHFELDGAHPTGAAHHQKIVVIDDALAFCGGIDMTADRWDTRQHVDEDTRRTRPSGRTYGPWHDATSAFDGDAAKALGELARERWRRATGEVLEAPKRGSEIWPDGLEPLLTDIDLAIARTLPRHADGEEIREIEALYLDCIAKAKWTLYCESQYFASRHIAEAMAERLKEADGPEIVVVNPLSAAGPLEAVTMDTARARLLKMVRAADRHGRFRIYTPVTERGNPIYVHAKILIVDDRLFRVGSSNFNNRSLGFDTECDVVIEAPEDHAEASKITAAIKAVRADLLAEHLGTTADAVQLVFAKHEGSLIATVEELRGRGRTLAPYEPDEIGPIEEHLAENELLDPERPPKLWRGLAQTFGLRSHPLR